MQEYEFSMTRSLTYKDILADFVHIRENVGQWKTLFSHILCSDWEEKGFKSPVQEWFAFRLRMELFCYFQSTTMLND